MRPIRLHFGYRTTDEPWGGANNFIRALKRELEATGRYAFTASMAEDCDVLFMNQLSAGPGATTTFAAVRRFREGRGTWRDRLRGGRAPRAAALAVRAVSLSTNVFRMGPRNYLFGRRRDAEAVRLLNFADFVVFQSRYQFGIFADHGYTGRRHAIIHNGADPVFWVRHAARQTPAVLRLAASTASPRAQKRHDLIARASLLRGVEVLHVGNWPRDVDAARVQRFGMVTRDRMAEIFAGCDYLFFPALRDACPNAIAEGICSGLPVIYHPGPGSSAEVVGPNGLALVEDDLDGTIRTARDRFDELRRLVFENREYYTVGRAAASYSEVFTALGSP